MEPSSQTPRPTPEEIENQQHFNEVRGELLNAREKAVQRWLTAMAAIATLVSIVSLFGGYTIYNNLAEIRRQKAEAEKFLEQIKKTKETAEKTFTPKSTQLPSEPPQGTGDQKSAKASAKPQGESPQGAFEEEWQTLKPNLVYQATSDGFIAAYTGGNNPAHELIVYTGQKQDSLTWRTRAGRYDGTVCPVPKDHYWTVRALRSNSETSDGVTVQWLPVISSDPDKATSDSES